MRLDDYVGSNVRTLSSISRTLQDKNAKRKKSVKSNIKGKKGKYSLLLQRKFMLELKIYEGKAHIWSLLYR